MSYNSFISYIDKPKMINYKKLIIYALKILLYFMVLEIFIHFNYSSFYLENRLWRYKDEKNAFEVVSFLISSKLNINIDLLFMWFKFLIIWRYFRFW
jgi:hypothetical protein